MRAAHWAFVAVRLVGQPFSLLVNPGSTLTAHVTCVCVVFVHPGALVDGTVQLMRYRFVHFSIVAGVDWVVGTA